MKMSALAVAAVFCVAFVESPRPSAQAGATASTGLIAGHIVDAVTGAPVPGAVVSLLPLAAGDITKVAQRAAVDANGGFVFAGLPRATYDIQVAKPGYMPGQYGKRQPAGAGASFELAEGQRVVDMTIRMWRFASISGAVLDEANEPVVGVAMQLRRRTFLAGRPRLRAVSAEGSVVTDDRGVYRFSGLTPGDYVVCLPSTQTTLPAGMIEEYSRNPSGSMELRTALTSATNVLSPIGSRDNQQVGDFVLQGSGRSIVGPEPGDSTMAVYRTTFFPDAVSPVDAGIVTLRAGESRAGIDLHVRPVPSVRITGTLTGPDGPIALSRLRLLPQGIEQLTSDQGIDAAVTVTDTRGAFTLLGVPAGQYVVQFLKAPTAVRPPGASGNLPLPVPDSPTRWVAEPVTVGTRDVELALTARDGYRVTGRFEFDGQKERPTADRLQQIPVAIEPDDARDVPSPITGHGDAAGGFSTSSVAPGRYFVRIGGSPSGWTVKSATLDGQDITDKPFELRSSDITGLVITFTDQARGEIRGTVRNATGTAEVDAAVVAFPVDPAAWTDFGNNPPRLKSTKPSSNGAYVLSALPAGDYFVAAVSDDASGGAALATWDPKFFAAVSRTATRVKVNLGAKISQDLTTAVIR